MDGVAPARQPWLLVAAALVLASMLAWVLFGAYIPSRQRMARLEAEILEVYQKEADLQTRFAQALQRSVLLERQITALTAEREGLLQRTRELEQELAALRKRRR